MKKRGGSIVTLLEPRPGLNLMTWRLQSTRRSMCDKFIFISFGMYTQRPLAFTLRGVVIDHRMKFA